MPEARYFWPIGPRGAVAALTLVKLLSPHIPRLILCDSQLVHKVFSLLTKSSFEIGLDMSRWPTEKAFLRIPTIGGQRRQNPLKQNAEECQSRCRGQELSKSGCRRTRPRLGSALSSLEGRILRCEAEPDLLSGLQPHGREESTTDCSLGFLSSIDV